MPVDMSSRQMVGPGLVTAHHRLGIHRPVGDTRVAVYTADDPAAVRPRTADRHRLHPDGDGLGDGAAAPIRRFLHRDHEPGVPGAPRSGRRTTRHAATRRCRRVSRRHRRVLDPRPARADRGQQGGHRGRAAAARRAGRRAPGRARLGCAWSRRCAVWRTNWTPTPRAASPAGTARTLRRCCVGSSTGTSCCSGISAARCATGRSSVDLSSRLGVLRLRQDVLPQLTHGDDLLVLAQATIPSYLRYGAYPYIVVVREHRGTMAIEHRFVGLFTVAATNANVLEIPLISRRVNDALAMAQRDPSHPGQLLLDIIQTIPRSELFALVRPRTARHGEGRRRSRFAPTHAAVHARRSARPLRVVPGVSAARPLHHRGPARDAGHPGSRARRRQHRVHRPSQ